MEVVVSRWVNGARNKMNYQKDSSSSGDWLKRFPETTKESSEHSLTSMQSWMLSNSPCAKLAYGIISSLMMWEKDSSVSKPPSCTAAGSTKQGTSIYTRTVKTMPTKAEASDTGHESV